MGISYSANQQRRRLTAAATSPQCPLMKFIIPLTHSCSPRWSSSEFILPFFRFLFLLHSPFLLLHYAPPCPNRSSPSPDCNSAMTNRLRSAGSAWRILQFKLDTETTGNTGGKKKMDLFWMLAPPNPFSVNSHCSSSIWLRDSTVKHWDQSSLFLVKRWGAQLYSLKMTFTLISEANSHISVPSLFLDLLVPVLLQRHWNLCFWKRAALQANESHFSDMNPLLTELWGKLGMTRQLSFLNWTFLYVMSRTAKLHLSYQ